MSKFSTRNFIEMEFGRFRLLKVSVDYCIHEGRHDFDIGKLKTLEVLVHNYLEYGLFFKAVKELMSRQCDAPATSDDCSIGLSQVYRLSFYYNDDCKENWRQEHYFMKFSDKFYKYVNSLGYDISYDQSKGCESDDNFYVSVS